jgi:hypothetical protein
VDQTLVCWWKSTRHVSPRRAYNVAQSIRAEFFSPFQRAVAS